jgi:hypothetical protein
VLLVRHHPLRTRSVDLSGRNELQGILSTCIYGTVTRAGLSIARALRNG